MLKDAAPSSMERAAVLAGAVCEGAKRLSIGPAELGRIIGVSRPVAARIILRGEADLRPGTKSWELAVFVVRVYRALFVLFGGDDHLAQGWLHAPNLAFAHERPIDVLQRIDGLIRVCAYLDTRCARS